MVTGIRRARPNIGESGAKPEIKTQMAPVDEFNSSLHTVMERFGVAWIFSGERCRGAVESMDGSRALHEGCSIRSGQTPRADNHLGRKVTIMESSVASRREHRQQVLARRQSGRSPLAGSARGKCPGIAAHACVRGSPGLRPPVDNLMVCRVPVKPGKHGYVHTPVAWPFSTLSSYLRRGIYPESWLGPHETAGLDQDGGE